MRKTIIGMAFVLVAVSLLAQGRGGPGREALRRAVVERFVQNYTQQASLTEEQRDQFGQALKRHVRQRQELATRRRLILRGIEEQMRPGVAADAELHVHRDSPPRRHEMHLLDLRNRHVIDVHARRHEDHDLFQRCIRHQHDLRVEMLLILEVVAAADGVVSLGRLAARLVAPVHVSQRDVIVGGHMVSEGKKVDSGTALYSEDGMLHAFAKATWFKIPTRSSTA